MLWLLRKGSPDGEVFDPQQALFDELVSCESDMLTMQDDGKLSSENNGMETWEKSMIATLVWQRAYAGSLPSP